MRNWYYKILFIALLSVLIVGCGIFRKKQIIQATKKDSTNVNSMVNKATSVFDSANVTPPLTQNITIINPCDSFGKLKPFNQSIKSGKSGLNARTKDNTLIIESDCEGTVNRLRVEKSQNDSFYSSFILHQSDSLATIIKNEKASAQGWKMSFYLLLILVILLAGIALRFYLNTILKRN
jgi:hypothetical protein